MGIPKELVEELGFDTDGYLVDFNPPEAGVSKILGQCPVCQIPRMAYLDKKTGARIAVRCPKVGQPDCDRCYWGGRGATPESGE